MFYWLSYYKYTENQGLFQIYFNINTLNGKRLLIILIGTPLSGKSTWAKKYVHENEHSYIVSRDSIRESIFAKYKNGTHKEEKIITNIVDYQVESLLKIGDVIIDEINFILFSPNNFFC